MNTRKNSVFEQGKLIVKSLVFTAIAVIMSTCDAPFGLGSQVDIGAPEISIESPSRNAYAKGSIAISGSASDDVKVARVQIILKRDNTILKDADATIAEDSWSYNLDTSSGEFDGELTLIAKAIDEFGKATESIVPIFVDNTAPSVLVTSPLIITPVPIYTDAIDIKGEVWDQSPINSVEVRLLKSDGTTALTDWRRAEGTNSWSIRFELKGVLPGLIDDEQYSYNVRVTDKAVNVNSYYFHRSGILAIKDAAALFPAMDEIGRIDQLGVNGASGITASELLAQRIANPADFAHFRYEADPQIEFDYSNIIAEGTVDENILAPGSKLSGLITPPTETGAIDQVVVKIWRHADYSADPLTSPLVVIEDSDNLSEDDNIKIKTAGDSANFTISLKDATGTDLIPGAYCIIIEAATDQGTAAENYQEFFLDADTPSFNETTITPMVLFKNQAFQMSFDGSHSTSLASIDIYQSYNGAEYSASSDLSIPLAGTPTSFTNQLSGNLPLGASLADGLYNYKIILNTSGGKTATLLRSITYDTTGPNVTITGFNSYVSSNKVNGAVTFSSISSDSNGIDSTKYFITNAATAPAFDSTVGGSIVQILADTTIETATLSDMSTYYLWVVTRDRAGNEGANTIPYNFQVDQSTDRPVVTLTSLSASITEESAVDKDNNLLILGGKISGSITDDDGVNAAWLEIDLNADGDFLDASERINLSLSGLGTTRTFEYVVSGLSEGTYAFRIDAADTNSTPVHNLPFADPVWFGYDTSLPAVVFNIADSLGVAIGDYRNADFTVEGTVQDTSGISKVEFSLDNGSTWADLSLSTTGTAALAWDFPIVAADNNGSMEMVVRATDRYLRSSQNTAVEVIIDTVHPTITLAPISGYIDTILSLSGTSSDDTSQIDTIEYSLDLDGEGDNDEGWNLATGTSSWFKNEIATGSLSEGAGKLVWVRATDKAGNNAIISGSFTVDHLAPVITIDATFDGAVYRREAFTINGSVSDTNLGAAPISISATLNGNPHTLTNPLTNGTTWSRLINLDGEGTYEITISASDLAGRISTEKRTVIVDTVVPTVNITGFNSYATGSKVNGTVTFSSISSDANGIDGTKYFITTDNTAPSYSDSIGGSIIQILAGQSIDTTTLTDLTTYYLWVVARDKAGNEGANSSSQSFQVDQSTDRPVVTLTSLSASIITETAVDKDNNLLVSGGKISGGITDDDGVIAAWLEIDLDHNTTFDGGAERINLTLLGLGTTKTFDYAVSGLTEGTYAFRIDAADTNSTPVHNLPFIDPVWFAYDTSLPTVVFNSDDSLGVAIGDYRNADFTVEGTVQDTSGISKVEFSIDNGSTWADLSLSTTDPAALAWDFAIAAASNTGTAQMIVRATDRYLRTNQNSAISLIIDTQAPTFSVAAFAPTYYADTYLSVSGTASDDISGLDLLEYCLDLDGDATADDGWNPLTGTSSWFKNDIATSSLSEGSANRVWIRASDMAGNTSTSVERTFTVDHGAPVISVDAAFDGSAYRNAAFTLSGSVSDGNLGASPISISAKKDGVTHTLTNPLTNGASWSRLINLAGDGVYVFTINAADAYGRSSSVERTVTVDSSQPNLEITSILPILNGATVNGAVTLSVNASDSNGLSGVKYFLRTDASTPAYTDAISAPTSGDLAAPYSIQIDTTTLTNATSYTLWVVARDRAGNDRLVSTTINVNQASDIPTATIESPADGEQIGVDRRLRGSFSDDDGVATSGAVLYIRKQGAPSYTVRNLNLTGSAGQQVAWSYDATTDLTAGGDGIYEVYLVVADDAGAKLGKGSVNTTTAVQSFLYDVNPPTVSTISAAPVQGAYAEGDAITLSWTASDSSGIDSQTIDIDGVSTGLGTISNPSGSNFETTYTVPSSGIISGNKTITLITTDNTGRASTRTLTILIDIDPPEVENAFTVNPAFVGSTPNGAFELKGTAYDNRGLTGVSVALSTDNVTYGSYNAATLSSGNWTYAIADSAALIAGTGTLYFRVMATDSANNTSIVREFSQSVDQVADKAIVTLISPVDASSYGTTVQISGTASDDDNLDGINPIDSDAIEIQYWGPLPDTTPTTVNPTISGTGRNANFNYSLSGLISGNYVVQARARDSNNNWGDWSAQAGFTVNAGAPNLNLTTVVDTFRNNANLTLEGTVADGQGVQYVRVRINGGSWTNAVAGTGSWGISNTSDTWSLTVNLGSDGLKTIEIIAADMGDFIANRQITTTLDSTPPSATFDAQFRDDPSGSFIDTSLLNKLVRVTGTVTELNLADTNPVEISIGGAAYVPASGTFVWSYVWDTSSLGDSSYELRLRITDKAGNITDTVTKTVSTSQAADVPQISQAFVDAPTAGDAGNNLLGALLKVSGTISDDDGFLAGAVNLHLDGNVSPIAASNTTGTTATWDYTWASLSAGTHYYTIEATDRNGNAASLGPTYFLVDTINPVLTVDAPSAGAKVKTGNLVISGGATDDGGLGTTPLAITLRHSSGTASPLHNVSFTPTVAGGIFSQTVAIDENSLDGTLFIDLVLTDRAGKQNSLTRAITIDTTAPVLNLGYPSSGAYLNGFVSFTGTADDPNGLSDVTLQLLSPTPPHLPVATIARAGTTLASWEFPFNLESYATGTYGVDVYGNSKLFKVLFKLTATDQTGNIFDYKVNNPAEDDWPFFYIDLDGDKPTISVTQPTAGANIGGIVNMFGSASDDDGPVMRVEVQIDFNGDGDFSDTYDINNNGSVQSGGTLEEYLIGADTFSVTLGNNSQPFEDESVWYAVAVTNNSWSRELNVAGELYASNIANLPDPATGNITIRTRSRDMYGLPSEISTRTIRLDETFPRIENVSPADKSYQNGNFDLLAEFGDDADLNLSGNSVIRVNINKSGYITLVPGANSGPGWSGTLTADLADPQNGYDLAIDIDTNHFFNNASGIFYVDLYVKDESSYVNQRAYTYYIDNQAPTSSWSDRPGAPDGLNLRNGQIRINNNPLYDYAFLEGNYLDSGVVSGVDRVEVYFVKENTVRRISGATGNLPSLNPDVTVPLETYNEGNGTWISTDTIVPFVSHADAGFGDNYVIRIDRPTEMSSISTGTDSSDSDSYFEFMGLDGGAQRFRAYFDSQYLPDGEIDIHYVVYDMAGNSVHQVRRGFIANNGPSFGRIRIGSDYNNNNSIADVPGAVTEILDYYYPAGEIDRLASSQPIRIKNGRIFFNVQSSDPNGTNQSTVINIVAPSPGTRGTLTTFSGVAGDNVSSVNPINISIPSDQFPSAGDYYLEVIVRDSDDIAVRRNIVITVLETDDNTKPTVTPLALTQANGIPTDADGPLGHLELAEDNTPTAWTAISDQYGSDDDPKASGEINLKATAFDENRISNLYVTGENIGPDLIIAEWNGTQLVPSATAAGRLIIDSQSLTESGHTVSFTYRWNTATVTGRAGLNKTMAFHARDAASNLSLDHSQLRFDVVPYITDLQRNPALYNTYRSRLGAFSVRQAENLIFIGFNIFNSTTDVVTFSNTGGTTSNFNLPSGGSATTFTIASLADTVSSGPVSLIVNSLPSLNNINDNTLEYNKEATVSAEYDGSALWTDDRAIHVWRSDDNQAGNNRGYFSGSIDPEYPAMTIDGTGVLYGSWSNYASSNIYYGPNNSMATQIFNGYDPSEHTDIHFGSRPTVIWNANLYGNGGWSSTGAGGVYVWDQFANAALDGNSGNAYESELLYHDQKLMQFINQRIVTSGSAIHTSYYDTDTKALKYWYHTSNTNPGYDLTWINIDGGADEHDGGSISNLTNAASSSTNDTYRATVNGVTVTSHNVTIGQKVAAGTLLATLSNGVQVNASVNGFVSYLLPVGSATPRFTTITVASLASHSVLSIEKSTGSFVETTPTPTQIMTLENYAGATTIINASTAGLLISTLPVGTAVDNTTTVAAIMADLARVVETGRSAAAGEFSAIAVTSTNLPVITYYDITNRTVKLAQASAVNPTASQWQLQTVMDPGDTNYLYSGKYITMKIDANGYVHIAFFRNSTGDLIYLRSTNNPTNGTTPYTFGPSVVIDSIGSVGVWTDITLKNNQPYISYLDSSMVNTFDGIKTAFYDPTLEDPLLSDDVAGVPDTIDGWETVNAALVYEVENVRTSIETDTGTNFWQQAIGYGSNDYFRIAYYVKQ